MTGTSIGKSTDLSMSEMSIHIPACVLVVHTSMNVGVRESKEAVFTSPVTKAKPPATLNSVAALLTSPRPVWTVERFSVFFRYSDCNVT